MFLQICPTHTAWQWTGCPGTCSGPVMMPIKSRLTLPDWTAPSKMLLSRAWTNHTVWCCIQYWGQSYTYTVYIYIYTHPTHKYATCSETLDIACTQSADRHRQRLVFSFPSTLLVFVRQSSEAEFFSSGVMVLLSCCLFILNVSAFKTTPDSVFLSVSFSAFLSIYLTSCPLLVTSVFFLPLLSYLVS